MAKAKVATKAWYEENRQLFTNEKGERFYDLPLAATMEIVHDKEVELGCKYSWKSTVIEMLGPWVVVEVTVFKDGVEEGSWLGSSANITNPDIGDVSPIILAQSQGLKSYFKRMFNECNLPVELSIVDQEQPVAPTPEEINLPSEEEPKKKASTKEKAAKKSAAKKEEKKEDPIPEPEVEEEAKEKVKEEEKEVEETTKEEPKNDSDLDAALNFVVNVGSLPYDGKTIEEVLKMPGSDVFLKHFASRINHEKYAVYKDFCEAAKVVVDAKGL